MKTLRISHVTDKNFSFGNKYYVVEEKKTLFKIFSYWKACKHFFYGMSVDKEDGAFIPYTFESVEKAKAFIKEKYKDFHLIEKVVYRVIPDGFDER